MLSRKKTKKEVKKPVEVQGKYMKKETSPLLRNLMPLFIRHGPTIPRRTDVCLSDPSPSTYPATAASGDVAVSRSQSFLRPQVQRPSHEVVRRESNRLSAPSYLARSLADVPQEYFSSAQSFLNESNSVAENGEVGTRYFYADQLYDRQRRWQAGDRAHEDFRYYEQSNDHFQRIPLSQSRNPVGKFW